MNKKAQTLSVGYIIAILVIAIVAIALVLAPMMGVQGEAIRSLVGGSGGPAIGGVLRADITNGFDFDSRGPKYIWVCGKTEADIQGEKVLYSGNAGGIVTYNPTYKLIKRGSAKIYNPSTDTEEISFEDLNCLAIQPDKYNDSSASFSISGALCALTTQGHIVKIKMLQTEPYLVDYQFQKLNYVSVLSGSETTKTIIEEKSMRKYKALAKEFSSTATASVPENTELTWSGYDFDDAFIDLTIAAKSVRGLAPEQEKGIDMWYSKDYGLFFFGQNAPCLDGKEIGHHQKGMYIGGSDNKKCSDIPPMLYHPNTDEIGYTHTPKVDGYYCIITNENRAVKVHWLGEEGKEARFEWWYN